MMINALGMIKTSFGSLQRFWQMQLSEFDGLASSNEETSVRIGQFKEQGKMIYSKLSKKKLLEITFRWMALLKINSDAYSSIEVRCL